MKKTLSMILVLFIVFSLPFAAFAENRQIYSETFDRKGLNSFVTGNLNGQHDWSTYTSGGTVQVIEATTLNYSKIHTAMKSVEVVDNSASNYVYAKKSFSNIGKGSLAVWMRAEQTNGSSGTSLREDTSLRIQAGFRLNGKISYYNGTTYTDTSVSYVANTWYKFVFEFDCSTDKYTLYVYDSSNDLKVYITDIDFYSPATAISAVQVSTGTENTGTYQFDDISINETDGYGSFNSTTVYDQLLADFEKEGYHFKNNTDGYLTEQESYALESMLVMYEATGQVKYVDSFLTHVNSMLSRMDTSLENTRRDYNFRDYRGIKKYGWQERYKTYGVARLYDVNGLPSLDIRPFNTTNQLEPSWNYIFKIEDGTDAGTFKLTIKDSYNTEVYDNLNQTQGSANYVETRINGISGRVKVNDWSKLGNNAGRPKNTDGVSIQRQGMIDLNNIAMIGYPMVLYARIVDETPALNTVAKYTDAQDSYVWYLEEMVKIFDNDWHTSGSEGWYTYKKGSPAWCDGADIPTHSQLAFGKLLIELYNVTSASSYLTKATALANWFKNDLALDNGSYIWHHAWTDATNGKLYSGWSSNDGISIHTPAYSGNQAWQDLGSSGIDVSFAILAYQNGLVFNATDIGYFINTFRNRIYNGTAGKEGRVYGTVNGGGASSYNPEVMRWILLSQYESVYYPNDELIYDTIADTIFEKQNQITDRVKLLGSAYIIRDLNQ